MPKATNHTAIFQVFDASYSHLVECFFSGTKGIYFYLSPKSGDSHLTYYIDKNAKVGTKFSIKVVISGGVLKIYYNGALN